MFGIPAGMKVPSAGGGPIQFRGFMGKVMVVLLVVLTYPKKILSANHPFCMVAKKWETHTYLKPPANGCFSVYWRLSSKKQQTMEVE